MILYNVVRVCSHCSTVQLTYFRKYFRSCGHTPHTKVHHFYEGTCTSRVLCTSGRYEYGNMEVFPEVSYFLVVVYTYCTCTVQYVRTKVSILRINKRGQKDLALNDLSFCPRCMDPVRHSDHGVPTDANTNCPG